MRQLVAALRRPALSSQSPQQTERLIITLSASDIRMEPEFQRQDRRRLGDRRARRRSASRVPCLRHRAAGCHGPTSSRGATEAATSFLSVQPDRRDFAPPFTFYTLVSTAPLHGRHAADAEALRPQLDDVTSSGRATQTRPTRHDAFVRLRKTASTPLRHSIDFIGTSNFGVPNGAWVPSKHAGRLYTVRSLPARRRTPLQPQQRSNITRLRLERFMFEASHNNTLPLRPGLRALTLAAGSQHDLAADDHRSTIFRHRGTEKRQKTIPFPAAFSSTAEQDAASSTTVTPTNRPGSACRRNRHEHFARR